MNQAIADLFPGLSQAGTLIDGARMGVTTSQAIGFVAMALGAFILVYRRNAGILPEVAIDDQEDMDLTPPVNAR